MKVGTGDQAIAFKENEDLYKRMNKSIEKKIESKEKEIQNLDALYEFIRNSKKYYFIVIGKCDFLKGLELQKNFVCIERYISEEELLYVMNFVDIIYCYYNNNKPSGFMGRAMQLNKYVIVKSLQIHYMFQDLLENLHLNNTVSTFLFYCRLDMLC